MIDKYVKNQLKEGGECQKVLGDLKALYELSALWGEHADKFHMIGLSEQINWFAGREFDSKELAAFKEGLAAIPLFLERCAAEVFAIENADVLKDELS